MATDSKDRVSAYRARMRARGLRPVQIWVPDVTTPEFSLQAHRQSLAVASSATAEADQVFVDELTDWDDE